MSIVFDNPLAEYADEAEHWQHSHLAQLVSDYHRMRARAMSCRESGNIPGALMQEQDADKLAEEIKELLDREE